MWEAKRDGGPQTDQARQAETDIQFLWDAIDVQEKCKYDDLWSGPDFDAHRWLLATWILRLQ